MCSPHSAPSGLVFSVYDERASSPLRSPCGTGSYLMRNDWSVINEHRSGEHERKFWNSVDEETGSETYCNQIENMCSHERKMNT